MDTRPIETVSIEGGHLALQFVNTLGGMRNESPAPADEMLRSYGDLLTWLGRVELLSSRDAGRLRRAAGSDEAAARRALARTRELRELVYSVFRPIAEGGRPSDDVLARLRDRDLRALSDARLVPDDRAMTWTWPAPQQLEDPLDRIAHAAVELLTEGPLDRIKVCANCRWLFLDESRNRSRRWCSMSECGTQIKHKQFVERRRARRGASA